MVIIITASSVLGAMMPMQRVPFRSYDPANYSNLRVTSYIGSVDNRLGTRSMYPTIRSVQSVQPQSNLAVGPNPSTALAGKFSEICYIKIYKT